MTTKKTNKCVHFKYVNLRQGFRNGRHGILLDSKAEFALTPFIKDSEIPDLLMALNQYQLTKTFVKPSRFKAKPSLEREGKTVEWMICDEDGFSFDMRFTKEGDAKIVADILGRQEV